MAPLCVLQYNAMVKRAYYAQLNFYLILTKKWE